MSDRTGAVKSGEKGFTLVELMITITVLGILAAGVITIGKKVNQRAHIANAVHAAECIQTSLTGIETWSPETQEAVIQGLGDPARFHEATEFLGCGTGPTLQVAPRKIRLFVDLCVVKWRRKDGSEGGVLCVQAQAETFLAADVESYDIEMTFDVPQVSGAQVRMTPADIVVDRALPPAL